MIYWGAVTSLPRPSGPVCDCTPGVRISESIQPVVLAAAATMVAAKLRKWETRPPSTAQDGAAAVPRAETAGPFAHLAVACVGIGRGSLLVRAFDARGPPRLALG
jgi:hypothetical protein